MAIYLGSVSHEITMFQERQSVQEELICFSTCQQLTEPDKTEGRLLGNREKNTEVVCLLRQSETRNSGLLMLCLQLTACCLVS